MSNFIRFRRIKKIIKIILRLLFVAAMIVCIIKFCCAEDIFDAVWYGVWMIVGLILFFRE